MLTMLLAAATAVATSALLYQFLHGWAVGLGMLAFMGVSFGLTRYFTRRLLRVTEQVQRILEAARVEAEKVVNQCQNKPGVALKVIEAQVEKITAKGADEALALLDTVRPCYKWAFLMERQVNTLRMMLYFQLHRFEEVDRLLGHVLLLEPLVIAMKMTRQYHHNDPALEKTFRKGIRRFKYDKAVILYALYAWILVKRREYDRALAVLTEAKDKTEDPVIRQNWDLLVNNRPQNFSNAGLGETWYALQLEKPPKPKVGKGQWKNHPLMGRGKRRFF